MSPSRDHDADVHAHAPPGTPEKSLNANVPEEDQADTPPDVRARTPLGAPKKYSVPPASTQAATPEKSPAPFARSAAENSPLNEVSSARTRPEDHAGPPAPEIEQQEQERPSNATIWALHCETVRAKAERKKSSALDPKPQPPPPPPPKLDLTQFQKQRKPPAERAKVQAARTATAAVDAAPPPSPMQDIDEDGYVDVLTSSPPHRGASPPKIDAEYVMEDEGHWKSHEHDNEMEIDANGESDVPADDVEDDDERAESSGNESDDSYGQTTADRERVFVHDRGIFPHMKHALLPEEEDEEEEREFEKVAAVDPEFSKGSSGRSESKAKKGKGKGRGKADAKAQKAQRSKKAKKKESADDADADDDDDDVEGPYRAGPLDKETQERLLGWKEDMESRVEALAAQVNKPSNLLWDVIESKPKGIRKMSAWNMFQRWLYAEDGGMRKKDESRMCTLSSSSMRTRLT